MVEHVVSAVANAATFLVQNHRAKGTARGEVPASLTLTLRFDDGQEHCRHFRIPAPTANVETLFRMVHTHLEDFTASSPIKTLRLAAQPALAPHEQFGLFEAALRDPNRFSETLARLYALLGADAAGVICPLNCHRPDAFRLDAPDFLHLAAADGAYKREANAASLLLRCGD